MSDDTLIYDDGRFQVSDELLSTPTRFYPVKNTTVRIRRDPLWFALALAAIAAATTWVYGDLLYAHELQILWGVTGLFLVFGWLVGILSIDAIGHGNTMFIARLKTIRAIYKAMRFARNNSGKRRNINNHDAYYLEDEL